MKIVLDTNVLISAIFFGVPYEILKAWQKGTVKTVISKDILTGYQRVA